MVAPATLSSASAQEQYHREATVPRPWDQVYRLDCVDDLQGSHATCRFWRDPQI
jgi:hypothetical protein